jgi:hypothetical protein
MPFGVQFSILVQIMYIKLFIWLSWFVILGNDFHTWSVYSWWSMILIWGSEIVLVLAIGDHKWFHENIWNWFLICRWMVSFSVSGVLQWIWLFIDVNISICL